jgi:hypothetical protein
LRLSRHGGWLINHVAASIEKPSPRCQRCGPHCFGYLSCLLSLGVVELFPGVNRDDDDTQKPKEKKHPTTELKCIFFQIQEKKGKQNKKSEQTKKENETNGCRAPAAVVVGTGRDVVSLLYPSTYQPTFYDWTSFFFFSLSTFPFVFFFWAFSVFELFSRLLLLLLLFAAPPFYFDSAESETRPLSSSQSRAF